MTDFTRTTTDEIAEAIDMVQYASQMGLDYREGYTTFYLMTDIGHAVPINSQAGRKVVANLRNLVDHARFMKANGRDDEACWEVITAAFERYTNLTLVGVSEGLMGQAWVLYPQG